MQVRDDPSSRLTELEEDEEIKAGPQTNRERDRILTLCPRLYPFGYGLGENNTNFTQKEIPSAQVKRLSTILNQILTIKCAFLSFNSIESELLIRTKLLNLIMWN